MPTFQIFLTLSDISISHKKVSKWRKCGYKNIFIGKSENLKDVCFDFKEVCFIIFIFWSQKKRVKRHSWRGGISQPPPPHPPHWQQQSFQRRKCEFQEIKVLDYIKTKVSFWGEVRFIVMEVWLEEEKGLKIPFKVQKKPFKDDRFLKKFVQRVRLI